MAIHATKNKPLINKEYQYLLFNENEKKYTIKSFKTAKAKKYFKLYDIIEVKHTQFMHRRLIKFDYVDSINDLISLPF